MTSQLEFSAGDILAQLDARAREHHFIVLDGGKEVPADCRLTLYRDPLHWAIVAEQIVYARQSPGFWGMVDIAFYAGNCVTPFGRHNVETLQVVKDAPGERAFADVIGFDVNENVRALSIRDQIVAVDLSEATLRRKGIPIPNDGVYHGQHLLWSLLPDHRDLLFASEAEKRRHLPHEVPKLMQLEEWNHPHRMTKGEMPSDSETFRMLAEVLASGDTRCYRPTLPPNTHWRNWVGYAAM